ncbi:MAG: TOMM precursor leader peptide-binding protein [Planctomycetota bacterium]
MSERGPFYRLLPGIEVWAPDRDSLALRSPAIELVLAGSSTAEFAARVLPLLDGRRPFAAVHAELGNIAEKSLRRRLDELVAIGVLARTDVPWTPEDGPLGDLVATLGGSAALARERLAATRVAIFGLAGAGAILAGILRRSGVGVIELVDPYPCRAGDHELGLPLPAEPGVPREVLVASALRRDGLPGLVRWSGAPAVDAGLARDLAGRVDFLVCTFDPDLAGANPLVNLAALATGRPALFGAIRQHRAVAGPRVVPGRSACYACWRLRRLACAGDFALARGEEERRLTRTAPAPTPAPAWPPLAAWLAGMLASDVVQAALALGGEGLVGRVVEHDFRRGTTETHRVLERPDCPACRGRVDAAPPPDGESVLARAVQVSETCGWVRRLERRAKDPSEPERPFLFHAELANHGFLAAEPVSFLAGSGKGMSLAEARASALGEAAERYAGSLPPAGGVVRAARGDLDGPALDPRRLVLYAPAQYDSLPYTPYAEGSVVAWMKARPWGREEELYVPALAVLLSHRIAPGEAFLFPMSSNGLAAGPSLAAAVRSALAEVAERDAFLHLWLHRLPARRVDPRTHPAAEVRELWIAYARRGVSLELYRMPTDHPIAAFLGLAVEPAAEAGPVVVVGLGADLDPARAARAALLEACQVRPALRQWLRDPAIRARAEALRDGLRPVASIDDHLLRYALPPALGSFAFLRERDAEEIDWAAGPGADRADPAAALELLAAHLQGQGRDVLAVDLTTPDFARSGLHVARVLVPDYQPLHFGRGERRLGGTRLFALPRLLGLRDRDATPAELNDDPHPLA